MTDKRVWCGWCNRVMLVRRADVMLRLWRHNDRCMARVQRKTAEKARR